MEDFKAINPQINVLDTNWRSDKNVILFNNMAFTSIANQLANSFDDTEEAQKRAETIRQIYSDEVKQKISPNAKEGYVQVSFMKSASSWQKQVLENLATTIEKNAGSRLSITANGNIDAHQQRSRRNCKFPAQLCGRTS